MNLYLVSQDTDTQEYDYYDSFVCAAESEAEARQTNPRYNCPLVGDELETWYWTTSDKVHVLFIGIAAEGVKGVICASYHAG